MTVELVVTTGKSSGGFARQWDRTTLRHGVLDVRVVSELE